MNKIITRSAIIGLLLIPGLIGKPAESQLNIKTKSIIQESLIVKPSVPLFPDRTKQHNQAVAEDVDKARLAAIEAAKPPIVIAPIQTTAAPPIVDLGSVWDRLANCESTNNWSINNGNGFYGGLQFDYSTWLSNGGGQYAERADLATREQQIEIASRLHARRGFSPWPACSIKLGLL